MNSLEILQFDMPTLIHHILISNNGVQNDVQGGEEIWENESDKKSKSTLRLITVRSESSKKNLF